MDKFVAGELAKPYNENDKYWKKWKDDLTTHAKRMWKENYLNQITADQWRSWSKKWGGKEDLTSEQMGWAKYCVRLDDAKKAYKRQAGPMEKWELTDAQREWDMKIYEFTERNTLKKSLSEAHQEEEI